MSSFERDLTNAWTKLVGENTPGEVEVRNIQESQATAAREESDKLADEAWRATGFTVPYDHRQAYADGVDFAKELPNKYYTPKKVNLAGHDLSTGRLYFPLGGKEQAQALIDDGVTGIRQSGRVPGKPPPDRDTLSLARIAYGHALNGDTFADFDRGVEALEYPPEHRRVAWQAGVDSRNFEFLVDHLEKRNKVMYMTHKESISQEERVPFAVTMADPKFIAAGRKIRKAIYNDKVEMSDSDSAQWLADHLRWIEWNFGGQALAIYRARNAPVALHQSYLDAIDQFERTDMEPSLAAQGMNAVRALVDPLNLVGGGVPGLTFKSAGLLAVKDVMRRFLKGGAIAGPLSGTMSELSRSELTGREFDPVSAGVQSVAGSVFMGGMGVISAEAAEIGRAAVAKAIKNYMESPTVTPRARERGALSFGGLDPRVIIEAPHDPNTGLYSPVRRAAAELPDSGSAVEMIKLLQSRKMMEKHGMRQEELDYLGLEEAFKDKKRLTKEEVLGYIDETRPSLELEVRTRETSYEGAYRMFQETPTATELTEREMGIAQMLGHLPENSSERIRLQRELTNVAIEREEAIRRIMRTLPRSDTGVEIEGLTLGHYGEKIESNFRNLLFKNRRSSFISGHFSGSPGTAFWFSTTDRILPGGKSTSHMEEAQSTLFQNFKEAKKEFARREAVKAKDPAHVPTTFEQHLWQSYRNFLASKVSEAAGDFGTELNTIVKHLDEPMMQDLEDIARARQVADMIEDFAAPRGNVIPEAVNRALDRFEVAQLRLGDAMREAMERGGDVPPSVYQAANDAALELMRHVRASAKEEPSNMPRASTVPFEFKDAPPSQIRAMMNNKEFWLDLPRQPSGMTEGGSTQTKKVAMAYGRKVSENAVRLGLYDAAARGKSMFTWAESSEIRKRYPAQGEGLTFDTGASSVKLIGDNFVIRGKNALARGATGERKFSREEGLKLLKDSLSPDDYKKVEQLGQAHEPVNIKFGVGGFNYLGREYSGKWTVARDGPDYILRKLSPSGNIEVSRRMTQDEYPTFLGHIFTASARGDDGDVLLTAGNKLKRWEQDRKITTSVTLTQPVKIDNPPFQGSYDLEMPAEARKFLKSIGMDKEVQPKLIDMPITPGSRETVKVWSIEITPKLREYLIKRGIALAKVEDTDGDQTA